MTHTLADFLQRALTWPDPDMSQGWVNLHWRPRERKGITGGTAFKAMEEVLNFVRWATTTPKGKESIADLYYCTSLQKEHGDPKPSGRYSALRSIDNAVSSRLLFADVDKYPDKVQATSAIEEFCKASNSPYPTAIVDSGGGLHAYWILPEPLSKELWIPLAAKLAGLMTAHGLLHDNITTDMARILRPPETFNYKRNKDGDPVVLKLLNGNVDLHGWKSLHLATPTPAKLYVAERPQLIVPMNIYLNDEIAKGPPGRKAFGKENNILAGPSLDAGPIIAACPMFNETFATGGKDVGQPVWHQQALACTFLINGRAVFHQFGCNHAHYNRADSDAMFDRKLADRAKIGLGYPSCATFEADGAPQCKTCPLKGKITSPLNARPLDPVEEREIDREILEAKNAEGLLPLPPPEKFSDCVYLYDEEGFICFREKKKNAEPVQLFMSRFLKGETFLDERGDSYGLRVLCTRDRSRSPKFIDISPAAFDDASMGPYKALNQGGCLVMQNPSKVTQLMCYFRGRLALEADAERNVPYGWEYRERKEGEAQGMPVGFAYSGMVYASGGRTRETHGGDQQLQETYCVTGMPGPWIAAVQAIQTMQSPAHEAVILSAFAAPLMIFSGQPSTVVMVRGDSGGSKSTASAIACAVWARPRTGVVKPNSSKLGVMRRMGRIRHLPTIWDDIRNSMFETVKDTLMEITQGGDGLKLDVNRQEREQGVWDNMLLTSSNASLAEYLETVSKQDGASLVRCFEFEVPKILQGGRGYLDFNMISPLIASLDHNHGHAGREYAKLLGADPVGLSKRYQAMADRFATLVKPYQPEERYWLAAAATILLAAELVNEMPGSATYQFNTFRLQKFLVETYLAQRLRLENANIHAEKSQFAKHWLGQFINDYAAPRSEIVWTSDAPAGVGKPAKTSPLWPTGNEARAMKRVSVRWVTVARKVRISKVVFENYLKHQEVSADRVKEGLVKFYKARLFRGRIAAGLDNVAAQALEWLYEIDVYPGSWLDGQLQTHAIADVPKDIGRKPPEQSPDPPEPRHLPEQKDPEDEKDAS